MKNRSPAVQQRTCANPHCSRQKIHAAGRCQACFVFWRRHGHDATAGDMSRRRGEQGRCRNCGDSLVYARERCKRCYQYHLRTGRERPVAGKGGAGLCLNCGLRPAYQFGRCRSCYGYLRLHGRDRQEPAP